MGWPAQRLQAPMIWLTRGIRQDEVESLPCTSFCHASRVYAMASRLSIERQGGQDFPIPEGANPGVGVHIHWAIDSRAIGYVNTVKRVSNIWTQPLAGGPPKQVTRFTSVRIFNFAWSPRRNLPPARGSEAGDVVLIRKFR
jgi:hypothetical protein